MYNITGIATNSTSFLSFVRGVNDNLTGGWLFTLILIGLCAIMFISFYLSSNDPNKSFAAMGFIGFALSVSLRALGLVPNLTLFATLIIAGLSVATIWND